MTTAFQFNQPPFDTLSVQEQRELASQLNLEYHPAGQTLIAANTPVDSLYVVMKGLVAGGDEQDSLYGEHELFDGKAVLEGLSSHPFVALEDTLVWQLPRAAALALCQRNSQFAAFFYQDVARRIGELSPSPQALSQAMQMLSRVGEVALTPLHTLPANASVLEATQCMDRHGLSAVLLSDSAGPRMFSQSDLRRAICAGAIPASTPASAYASTALFTISPDATLHEAMLLMIRHSIHRLVVSRDGELVGILEQLDLLSSLANNPHSIGVQIERASSPQELKLAAERMHSLIQLLQHSGMKVTLIAEMIGELRQKLLARLWQLLAPPELTSQICLLALGSEGRGEQILRTDQDNALIYADDVDQGVLARVAEQFTATLITLGYPPCPGGVMISNPAWRRSEAEFRQQISAWTSSPSGEHVMNLAIWLDASPIIGNTTLLYHLQDHLDQCLDGNTLFMGHFALPIERFASSHGLRPSWLPGAASSQIDLKKAAIFPLVHGLRSLALAARNRSTNSYQRLAALRGGTVISEALGNDLAASLSFLQGLQLKYGLQAQQAGRPAEPQLALAQLSSLERELLKDALGVVKQFRTLLRHHFKLDAL
ncbi:DUF294 nucleotidyltransferase-like domain-containing protein [Chitinibacter sp. ZOR0017]|uniref:DUF294 nucleotidyltransferase-like domain-containing protein n=1 Tax=Chitinibacter sp. ZOR0017 TaxID=1339254 RepID=UPI000646C9FE|nr:DUF294 nucleotidyltransferase-like domain-containing protein [Chitinibacter sp. ZOR0017]